MTDGTHANGLSADEILGIIPGVSISAAQGIPSVNEVWARVDERIGQLSQPVARSQRNHSLFTAPWMRVALVAVIVATVAVRWSGSISINMDSKRAEPEVKTYSTSIGQRANIKLPDGTDVKLNVASRLYVPNDFGATTRNLVLDGEAQFIVKHNKKLPFTINANGTMVRDLATTFVVRSYKGDAQTTVAVRDGRVAVQAPTLTKSNIVALGAGQVVKVTIDGAPQVTSPADVGSYFGWINGELVLRDVPLGQALVTLSRWYGKEFRVADSALLSSRINTVLPARFSQERVKGLAEVIGAKADISGNIVTFIGALP